MRDTRTLELEPAAGSCPCGRPLETAYSATCAACARADRDRYLELATVPAYVPEPARVAPWVARALAGQLPASDRTGSARVATVRRLSLDAYYASEHDPKGPLS